jgi:hypothetical protein
MNWQNGIQWATSLGQYGILAELGVMGALWILGAVVDGLFRSRRSQLAEIDGDD